ncbi:natural resistance-associated macrophage protein [Lichtheimia hyalospora FSU 10163]|nr:natural resistance-associated macrophage protein [Lichtheimia hyalospora FSU 10163]
MRLPRLVKQIGGCFRQFTKFIGPGFMVAVGYLDPGNWATDMEGGSQFGYRLLFIILLSNIIAIFLQNMTIRMGTVTGLDLASASRRYFPKYLNLFLYLLAELAIIATDMAEVIGSAIALNLLFPSLPLPAGVAITAADVFIILLFYSEEPNSGQAETASMRVIRVFETFVMFLVLAVGICLSIILAESDANAIDVLKGYVPTREIFTDPSCLYVAIGIIGATVMPHNLYLHGFIVQSRCRTWRSKRPEVEQVESGQWYLRKSLRDNLVYGFIDLVIALIFAFYVNCAILAVASANFYYGPDGQNQVVDDLFGAHHLLSVYLGPAAGVIFALALLCAGQSSTITATLAGQVVMAGFLGMTTRPWVRRIVTRLVAIAPALVAACIAGRSGLNQLLVASQVALSIQLPFAVVPLVYFTSRKHIMKLDLVHDVQEWPKPLQYENGIISGIVAGLISLLLIGLNGYLVVSLFMGNT